MKIYVLTGFQGEYSCRVDWNCCAFTNREPAEKLKKELNALEDWRWQFNPEFDKLLNKIPYDMLPPRHPHKELKHIPKGKYHLFKYYLDCIPDEYDQAYFDVEEIELKED
jgi:hypothetical protein